MAPGDIMVVVAPLRALLRGIAASFAAAVLVGDTMVWRFVSEVLPSSLLSPSTLTTQPTALSSHSYIILNPKPCTLHPKS